MSRKKIEAYNTLMKDMDQKAAAHLVKLGIGKSAKENLKNWKARKDRMKVDKAIDELKNPFTTIAVRLDTRARLKTLAKKRFQSVTGLIEQLLEKAEKDENRRTK
jgi:isoleucyl-tRNA synthetase